MRYIFSLCFFLFFIIGISSAQTIKETEKKFKAASNTADKAKYANQLAKMYLNTDAIKARGFADAAIKNAKTAKIKRIEAEALNFKAKATAGYFYPNGNTPRTPYDYDEAVKLFEESKSLARRINYPTLELDNIENLAYINSRTIKRHKPDLEKVIQYYQEYASRTKAIKKITTPEAVANVIIKDSSPKPKPEEEDKPTKPSSTTDANFTRQLVEENKDFRDKIEILEGNIAALNKDLQLATSSGTSQEELDEIRKNLELREMELTDIIQKKDKDKERLIKKYKGTEYQLIEAKEAAELLEMKNNQFKYGAGLGGLIALLVLSGLYLGYRTQKRGRRRLAEKNEEIEKEKERSDELLLNILPADIAQELKTSGAAKAKKHNNATVFFSDFKNFTKVSERLTPEDLVKELDYCFKGFDHIIAQYPSIEKIKTIGDAYMCVSGLAGQKSTAVTDMINAALDMQEFLFDYKADRQSKSMPFFEARIGIHTGPVVAGVVGNTKFAYDVWGDTVNVASRMESNGDVGKVNISAHTFNEIRYKFACQSRGKINVKNKGLIEMYFVDKAL